jgi:hypothetical protein
MKVHYFQFRILWKVITEGTDTLKQLLLSFILRGRDHVSELWPPTGLLLIPQITWVRRAIIYSFSWSSQPGDRGSIPGRGERIFLLVSVTWPALGPTQPPVQWVPGVLSPGVKRGRGVTLTTHPHLVLRSRMSRTDTSSPHKRLRSV